MLVSLSSGLLGTYMCNATHMKGAYLQWNLYVFDKIFGQVAHFENVYLNQSVFYQSPNKINIFEQPSSYWRFGWIDGERKNTEEPFSTISLEYDGGCKRGKTVNKHI